MSDKKWTRRDKVLCAFILIAPFLSFMYCVSFDSILENMIGNPWLKIYVGFANVVLWMGIVVVGRSIDKLWSRMEERKKMEINDPSLAFGFYLFDKKRV